MAFAQTEQNAWKGTECVQHALRLGKEEQRVILQAQRDAQAGRPGLRIQDPRLEALRLYAMLDRYRPDAVRPLLAAGFSPAERYMVDAMLNSKPAHSPATRPATGRLILAGLIQLFLLVMMNGMSENQSNRWTVYIATVLTLAISLIFVPAAIRCRRNRCQADQSRK